MNKHTKPTLYAVVKVHRDGGVSHIGQMQSSLKRAKTRLSKIAKGWIIDVNTQKVVVMRGFSRSYIEAGLAVGVENYV